MPWIPEYPGEVPSLGGAIIQWVADYLVVPDNERRGNPFVMTDWQQQFTLDLYALNPWTGKRINRRGAAILAKGIGKSPWAAALGLAEFLGPVVFDGWDANGRPVGRPWVTPYIQIAATAEDQTGNTYDALYGMVTYEDEYGSNPLLDEYPQLDPGRTRVYLRGNPLAQIEPVTSEAGTREGQRITFAILDETGLWRASNGGISLAATIRRNVGKMGGLTLETTNTFVPGEDSVAEKTHRSVQAMREGRTRSKQGIVYMHTQAPPDTIMSDRESLLRGLHIAYMDTPWVDYDRLVEEIWDPATDPSDARRFYLNQIVSPMDSWITVQEWDLCKREGETLAKGETITLGFDGAINNDATALVACRLDDGHLFPLRIWEKPPGSNAAAHWEVDVEEVDAEVDRAFADYEVVAFFADPPEYQDSIARWNAKYGRRLRVKASGTHPIEFWTRLATNMVAALERFRTAVRGRTLTHSDHPTLTQHVLNAKTKMTTPGLVIRKDYPNSDRKIDAAMAACLAYEARARCIAAGVKSRQGRIPTRIR